MGSLGIHASAARHFEELNPWMAAKKDQLVWSLSARSFISLTPRAYHKMGDAQSSPSSHIFLRIFVIALPRLHDAALQPTVLLRGRGGQPMPCMTVVQAGVITVFGDDKSFVPQSGIVPFER